MCIIRWVYVHKSVHNRCVDNALKILKQGLQIRIFIMHG